MLALAMAWTAVLLGGSLAPAPVPEAPTARVTYVANEGFLIDSGGKKILVDALFHGEVIDRYHAPPAETQTKLETAAAPFDRVDLILVTHWHDDHFTPEVVLKHLTANPDGVLAASPQVVSRLRSQAGWTGELDKRVREIDVPLHGSADLEIHGIRLRASRLRHGAYMIPDGSTGGSRDKHEAVENLVFRFEVAGVTFMHFGDALLKENPEFFDGKRFAKQTIDFVFLEGWSDETLAILGEWMAPGHVIFMHMPADPDRIERLSGYLAGRLENAVVFREPMESRSF